MKWNGPVNFRVALHINNSPCFVSFLPYRHNVCYMGFNDVLTGCCVVLWGRDWWHSDGLLHHDALRWFVEDHVEVDNSRLRNYCTLPGSHRTTLTDTDSLTRYLSKEQSGVRQPVKSNTLRRLARQQSTTTSTWTHKITKTEQYMHTYNMWGCVWSWLWWVIIIAILNACKEKLST